MADVFISHAREDSDTAQRLAAVLESHGWSVWLDSHIAAGERWDDVIERELAAAKCVAVLWSCDSVKSTWVRNEARRGLQAGRLIPAILDRVNVQIPVEFDGEQTADLKDWDGDATHPGCVALVAGVDRVLRNVPGAPAIYRAPITPHVPVRWTRRTLIYLSVLTVLFAGGVLAYRAPWASPSIVLMDSPLPDVVYDKEAAAKGQTNASVLADILRDLPVSVLKESTDLEWHREEEMRRLNPSLIIIHSSAFYSKTNGSDNAGKLFSFLDYMKTTQTRFLIYSRVSPVEFEQAVRERIPALTQRVQTWQVPGGANASFTDPVTRRTLKQIVAKVLNL
jgi:hypothetical protein